MPEFNLGATFIVLIPGVLVYCALYGIFSGNNSPGQEPPDAHSIQSLTVILLGATAVHLVTSVLIAVAYGIGATTNRFVTIPGDLGGYYVTLASTMAKDAVSPSRDTLAYLIVAAVLQAAIAYALVRTALNSLAKRDALPRWLYGWTAPLVNQFSNEDKVVIAYVLTDIDVSAKAILYVGALSAMNVSNNGCIQRINLIRAERHCVALTTAFGVGTSAPLAVFDRMVIESAHIRNISFSIVPTPLPRAPPDLLASALRRLYGP